MAELSDEFSGAAELPVVSDEPILIKTMKDGAFTVHIIHENGMLDGAGALNTYMDADVPEEYRTHHGHLEIRTIEDLVASYHQIPQMSETALIKALDISKERLGHDLVEQYDLNAYQSGRFIDVASEIIGGAVTNVYGDMLPNLSDEDRQAYEEIEGLMTTVRNLQQYHRETGERIKEISGDLAEKNIDSPSLTEDSLNNFGFRNISTSL